MRVAAAEEEERAAEEERRRVRKGRRDTLCGWIRARLDLANHPLPSAPCPAVIADCLERVRIFGQPLTGCTLKDYCFRNPEQGLDLLLSLRLDPATALRLRDGPPPRPRVRRAAGDLPVVSAPSQKRRLGPRFYAGRRRRRRRALASRSSSGSGAVPGRWAASAHVHTVAQRGRVANTAGGEPPLSSRTAHALPLAVPDQPSLSLESLI